MTRLAAAAALLLCAATARADDRPVSVGPYAELGIGAVGALGEGESYTAVGPLATLRAGTDLASWLSVGARLSLSSHEATVPAPPEGEYLQLYAAAGEARLSLAVGRVGLYADGGAGLALISTDVLTKVGITDPGERFTLVFSGGGGLEYQLQNRHYALGLGGDWSLYPAFSALQAVSGRAYLRYTY